VSRQPLLVRLGASQREQVKRPCKKNILVKQRRTQSAKIGKNYFATT
jgi:hypothetical protein